MRWSVIKQRLFWKILSGVWAMFLVVTLGIWVDQYFLYLANQRATVSGYIEDSERETLRSVSIILRYGGRHALDEFLTSWPDQTRHALTVRPATDDERGLGETPQPQLAAVADRSAGARPMAATVLAPDGAWRVSYRVPWTEPRFNSIFPLYLSTRLFLPETIASLLFSALLAWYLTRPVRRLKSGFERLAQGDLGTRLNADAWQRRDEITDLVRDFDKVADRMQQLVQSRDQLLHDVSHELRTPLTRLRLAIDLAQQDPGKNINSSLARIDSESRRIDEMVGELLTLSRAESGLAVKEQYFDLPELVRTVVRDAAIEADRAGVRIVEDIAEGSASGSSGTNEIPPLKGDAEILRRGLENIVRNALRFSTAGQTITVRVVQDSSPPGFRIEVGDSGPGVPPESLASMFDPFVRVSPSHQGNGFGLGLAIAKRAVLAHRGTIEARNRPEGGLTVSVSIPL